MDDAPERYVSGQLHAIIGVELLITSVISRRRAVPLLYRPAGRWSERVVTGLGNACFFVGKLLDFGTQPATPAMLSRIQSTFLSGASVSVRTLLCGSIVAIIALSGCSGTAASEPETAKSAAASTGSQPPSAESSTPGSSEGSLEIIPAPSVYSLPPLPSSFEPYNVAAGVSPSVEKSCASLNIGVEVYATIGNSTLREDSDDLPGQLVCIFATDGHTKNATNWLAVATRKDSVEFFKAVATDTTGGIRAQDISGIGDAARFYAVQVPGSPQYLYAIKGPVMITVTASFKDVPAGADLSPLRYGSIIKKIYGE